jgi:outer membrane protein TolC
VLFAYEDARRKIGLYRDGLIAKARQSINVSYSAYEGGEVELLTVLDAQRQLLEFELQLQQSLTERARRLAELEMLTAKQLQ